MSESPVRAARHQSFRARLHLVLDAGPDGGVPGSVFDGAMMVLIIANVLAVTLESVPHINAEYGTYFDTFEDFSIVVFTVEYLLRLWTAPEEPRFASPLMGRARYALTPLMLIDLLAFAPAYFVALFPFLDARILRVFRLLRILKVVRYSPAMSTLAQVIAMERRALVGTLILMLTVMCISAEIMHVLEGTVQSAKFGTLPDAMWWAIVTLTTVGYGDVVPHTAAGKMVASVTMILGLGLFALPVGIVATGFMQEIHRRDFAVSWGMLARVKLFRDLDIEAVGEVVGALRAHLVPPGTRIVTAGAAAEAMYFVISGEVEEDDRVLGKRRLHPGDFFGEAALLHDGPYTETVTARSRARLLALPAEDCATIARKYPMLRERIAEHVAERAKQDVTERH
jgi:voltage-gated potassium channel